MFARYWDEMSLPEKVSLIWGMRYERTLWEKVRANLSIKCWVWRYNAAKDVANIEASYSENYLSGAT